MKAIKKAVAIILVALMVTALGIPAFAVESQTIMPNMHELDSAAIEVIDAENGINDSYGNNYRSNILRFDASYNAYATYDLNGKYSSFTGKIVASDETGGGASMNVGIFADGKEVFSLTDFTRQKDGVEVSLDLKGVRTLDVKTSNTGEFSRGYLFFVGSYFTQAENATAYSEWAGLNEMVVIDSGSYTGNVALFKDPFGKLHNGSQHFDASYNGFSLFNLDKKFVTFSGKISAQPDTGAGASMTVVIYCDDKEVFKKSGISKTKELTKFSIDVTGVKVLKIETSNQGEWSKGYVSIVDDKLAAHEHKAGDWTVETPATCTEDGSQYKSCTECEEVIETESIPATGHIGDGNWKTVTDATCSKEGKEGQTCTVCGEPCEERTIDKVAHTPSSEWEVVDAATCDKEGTQIKSCTVCGEQMEEEVIPTTEHDYGDWSTISGSVWNNPIVKERTCSICGDVQHTESNATSWVKPLVLVLFLIVIGGGAVVVVTLKMNGLPMEIGSVKKLLKKENLTDDDIDNILNKSDDE